MTAFNHNLIVTFIFKMSAGIAQGIWNFGIGSTYIYFLEHKSNTLVGVVQGIQGICIPLAAVPAGWIADRTRRDLVLRACGVACFAGVVIVSTAVLIPQKGIELLGWATDIKYLFLCIGMAFWGIAQAANPVVEAILADSTPTGLRSNIYTYLFIGGAISISVGPLLAGIIFYFDGNRWELSSLSIILLVGMGLSVIPAACLFFFNDDQALGAESEAHERDGGNKAAGAKDEEAVPLAALEKRRLFGLRQTAIPYILATADCITGLASGMTIKYFPIFFAEQVQLAPVATNFMLASTPVLIALLSIIAQRLATVIGRIQVMLLMRLIGFSTLLWMGLDPNIWHKVPLIIGIYQLRTAANNCSYPIQKSVLMDFVPKKHRGKWNSVESIMIFGWSGSALLGGWLVDEYGFDVTFIITGFLQAVGWVVLFLLLPLVPVKETVNEAVAVEVGDDSLATPLLAEGGPSEGDWLPDAEAERLDSPTGDVREEHSNSVARALIPESSGHSNGDSPRKGS